MAIFDITATIPNMTPKLKILDPDGWDRLNYDYSFYEELITEKEFIKRVLNSTIKCSFEYFKNKA